MRKRIMEESIDLFDRKGFSETSIQDIVDEIGVTKGSFYYYFKSKLELLKEIHLSYIEDLLREQEEILKRSDRSCKEKLYDCIYLVISKIKTDGKSARITMREMRHLEKEQLIEIKERRKDFRKNLQNLIDEGLKNGEFHSEVRTDILTFAILGMVNRSFYWYDPNGELNEDQLADLFLDFILNGIK